MANDLLERLEFAGKLPTPPGVVHRLLDLTRQPDTAVRDVADAISADPALAAKILRFVNSPMAGIAREVTSLQQAVALVGVRGVTTLALSLAVLNVRNAPSCAGFDRDQFNIQSVACGAGAKTLAQLTRAAQPQDAFSAGLFSQIGRSIFATALPEEYGKILSLASRAPRDLPDLERAQFGHPYSVLGAHLLRRWGLPESLCLAVQLFREPPETPNMPALARLLNGAEIAATIVCSPQEGPSGNTDEYFAVVHRDFGVSQDAAIAVLHETAAEVRTLKQILELPKGHVRNTEQIEADVRERIAEMSIAMHLENQSMAQQQADLLRRASTDALTGIGNRAAFNGRMEHEVERAIRTGEPFGLLLIDVDKFKNFNDTHGHPAGDRVLQTVARVLDENVRKVDFVARYGGEEFAVIAPGTPTEGVALLAERLRQGVEAAKVSWDGKQLGVTISIGVAVYTELVDRKDAATILRIADGQLYKAKASGRNRVVCASGAQPCLAARQ